MSFNINDFKASGLKLGGARPSQFSIQITAPFGGNAEQITMLARAASVPPSVLEEVPVFYFGRAVKFNGDRVFPDWEVTILNDEDYALRNIFENWSNEMNTLISNRMSDSAHPLAYKADAHVTHYGKDGRIIREYSFQGLWPKVVDTMQLDWAAVNQIQEFNVVFAYDLWTPAGPGAYSPTLTPA